MVILTRELVAWDSREGLGQQAQLQAALVACRQNTLDLVAGLGEDLWRRQIHPEFSPLGWHLGHIALTEAQWLLPKSLDCTKAEHRVLFAADGLPKHQRESLPPLGEILTYLARVRERVLERLAATNRPGKIWVWVLQHESQHAEILTFLRQLGGAQPQASNPTSPRRQVAGMVEIPGGPFVQGSNHPVALDHEGPAYLVDLPRFWLDPYPVTQGQFDQFIAAGGYQERRYWSAAGWAWQQQAKVTHPLYWRPGLPDHPVCGVNAYEAEAYCRFAGKRLPTEPEWEKAAQDAQPGNYHRFYGDTTPVDLHTANRQGIYDLLGNVWEWTATTFGPYPGFRSYPYPGYSQAHFDGCHRILKGGSWGTLSWSIRPSARNWYLPEVRQILAGFRCAQGG